MKKRVVGALLSATALGAFIGLSTLSDDDSVSSPSSSIPQVAPKMAPATSLEIPQEQAVMAPSQSFAASAPSSIADGLLCPSPDSMKNDDDLMADLAFQRAMRSTDAGRKFTNLFDAFYDSSSGRFDSLKGSRAEYGQQLQKAAQTAFDSLIKQYPHGTLQAMDQSTDLSADVKGREMAVLRDIHTLRWSMSNLVQDFEMKPDVEQSKAQGGVDIQLLNRLVAKLVVAAYPKALDVLKSTSEEGVFTNEQMAKDYAQYYELFEYVTFKGAYSDAGLEKPEWPQLGFENRKAALAFKHKADATVSGYKSRFIQSVQAACAPASAPK